MQIQDLQYFVVPDAECIIPTLVLLGSKGIDFEYLL
jgi:hypothetical protein